MYIQVKPKITMINGLASEYSICNVGVHQKENIAFLFYFFISLYI